MGCGFWCSLFKWWIPFLVHFFALNPLPCSLAIIPHVSLEEAAPPLHIALKIPGRITCQGSSAGHWPARCWPHVLCGPSQGRRDSMLRFFLGHCFYWTVCPLLWYGCWDDTTESTQLRSSQIQKRVLAMSLNLNQTLLQQKPTGTLQLHEPSISPSLAPCLLSLSCSSWVF